MKKSLYLIVLALLACHSQSKKADALVEDTVIQSTNRINASKYYTSQDNLRIADHEDTLTYSREEFNQIVDEHPELVSDFIESPDATYYSGSNKGKFSSEVGQDSYYVLYAYFLKQKNGLDKYAERRRKFIKIYESINELFQRVEHGGTYFAHQYSRIVGYAEYSVYLYKRSEGKLLKTYDIGKQKSLYIKSLRQLIDDEVSIDSELLPTEKHRYIKELNQIVDKIELEITDNFYLRQTQEFQFGHYQYY